jgi:hypothetical protein
MIIIGYEYVPYKPQYVVDGVEAIAKTPSNATLFLKTYDEALMRYCRQNALEYSVCVESVTQLIVANALGATYIVTKNPKRDQKIATNYLFDAKILTFIKDINEIESLVEADIDGVIFESALH